MGSLVPRPSAASALLTFELARNQKSASSALLTFELARNQKSGGFWLRASSKVKRALEADFWLRASSKVKRALEAEGLGTRLPIAILLETNASKGMSMGSRAGIN